MKKTQLLDAFRNIRKEIVAFLSIVMIGLLAAVAFLSITYAAATLKSDAVRFFNDNRLWDVEVTSTMLMTDEDLKVISAVPGVSEAEPVWQIDTRLRIGDHNTAVSVVSLPKAISLPILQEGRLPESAKECAIEKKLADEWGLAVGQEITLNCDPILEVEPLLETNYLITGVFYSPDHFSYMVPVTPYILVQEECFNREGFDGAFMKVRIRVDGTPENRYSTEYGNAVQPVIDALESMKDERAARRAKEVQNTLDEKFREGEAQIQAGREELEEARVKIEDGTRELAAAAEKLGLAGQLIDNTEGLLQRGKSALDENREKLEKYRKKLDDAVGTVTEKDWPEGIGVSYEEYSQATQGMSLEEKAAWLYEQSGYNVLAKNAREAELIYEGMRNNWYYSGEEYLDAVTRYQKGKKQLEDGERELAAAEEKIQAAERELNAARENGSLVGICRWVILDNNGNPGYVYGAANSDKLSSLSLSFSTIFLVVGALVIYATVARMVEQQRKLIGVNKALGLYSREIFAKYLIFACGAVILGVGGGILLSWLPLQRAILSSYEAHMNYGVGTRSFLPYETGLVVAGALGISVISVYLGCSNLLRQPALALMQGTKPKPAGRKKTSSSKKKSLYARLILRNMRSDWNRVLVTVVSIAGGCVLMVTGFTLRYGISGVPDRQFGGILTYDAEVIYDTGKNADAASEIAEILDRKGLQHISVHKESTVYEMDETLNAVTMIVAEKSTLDHYYLLQDLAHKDFTDLPDSGALVPRRFWEYHNIEVGDSVTVLDSGMNRREIPIADVFENYYGQLFFLSPQAYEKVFEAAPENNCFFVKTNGMTLSELQKVLKGIDGVVSINDAAAERSMIEQFTSSLNFVVYFMLFIAGMMACFIVANFTITFIQRKTSELTIMRINGFTSGECIRYVAADLVVTTVLGTAVGLAVGGVMGARILRVTETSYIQMIREPRIETFLFAALITFCFSAVTNGLALRRIRKLKLTDL